MRTDQGGSPGPYSMCPLPRWWTFGLFSEAVLKICQNKHLGTSGLQGPPFGCGNHLCKESIHSPHLSFTYFVLGCTQWSQGYYFCAHTLLCAGDQIKDLGKSSAFSATLFVAFENLASGQGRLVKRAGACALQVEASDPILWHHTAPRALPGVIPEH